MKRSIRLVGALVFFALIMALVAGCDAIKDSTSYSFTVKGVKFDFKAFTKSLTGSSSLIQGRMSETEGEGRTSFSGSRIVDIDEITSSEFAEYLEKIQKVAASNSVLRVTFSDSGVYTVYNLKITVDNLNGSLEVPSYTIGDSFTPPSNIIAYTASFIMKLVNDREVTVRFSGETDAPADTEINIEYENDLLFTASL
ncbi:MAG: hypothetical protein FWG99_06235 [Treponema sp.]|nr:hypothetical protein [Treponema sp.]